MSKTIPVTIVKDDAVDRKIKSTACSLQNKYSKRRKINEAKLMKNKSKFSLIMSKIGNCLFVCLILFSLLICLTTFLSRLKKTAPTFAGYSFMQIVSGSMAAESITINGTTYSAGHQIGDKITLRAVDTNTLNVGDKIAFYVYTPSLTEFHKDKPQLVNETHETEYKTSFSKFLGFAPNEFKQAGELNSKLVFHHIIEIYETTDGTRYFRTQGATNTTPDYWTIKDCYVVGIHDESIPGKIVGGTLSFLTSRLGLLVTIITPMALIGLLMFLDALKNVGVAKLELDCIEEKRKITDPICVKNNVGFNMSKKNKYKILAQANQKDKLTYIGLLWRDGKAPNAIKKYIMRKDLLLRPNRKLLELNRKCEKMFKQGKKPETVAKFYLAEKEKIEQEQQALKTRLKLISKHYKQKGKANNEPQPQNS